jgi:ankyrin repeat protein
LKKTEEKKFGQTASHLAAACGNLKALCKLWEYAKDQLTPEEFNSKLLLAEYIWGRTAWHMAAEKGNPELLDILMLWATELLTPEDILVSNKFPFAKDDSEQTTWHGASKTDNTEI